MRANRHLIPLLALIALLSPGLTPVAQSQEVLAVLSSDLKPYREALAGLEEAFDGQVEHVQLADHVEIGRETRVIVAFGGQASARTYPDRVTVISCLAPGGANESDDQRRNFVKVAMLPAPAEIIARLKQIQPNLQRLAAPWMSQAMAYHIRRMDRAAADAGIELVIAPASGANDLPDLLRTLLDKGVEALWLPPDPLLINKQNIAMFKEFCWSNDIPFYVPTAGLVKQGAVGAIASEFREMGRTAGQAAQAALANELSQQVVYPRNAKLILNIQAATNSGLSIPAAASQQAAKVLP